MLDFEFYAPTRVLFGKESMKTLPEQLQKLGASKVMLVHYGEGGPMAPVNDAKALMDKAGIAYQEFSGIKPNPLLSRALEGVQFCKQENVDFILAVGGASVIDTAKAIAAGVKLKEGEDLWKGKQGPDEPYRSQAQAVV